MFATLAGSTRLAKADCRCPVSAEQLFPCNQRAYQYLQRNDVVGRRRGLVVVAQLCGRVFVTAQRAPRHDALEANVDHDWTCITLTLAEHQPYDSLVVRKP